MDQHQHEPGMVDVYVLHKSLVPVILMLFLFVIIFLAISAGVLFIVINFLKINLFSAVWWLAGGVGFGEIIFLATVWIFFAEWSRWYCVILKEDLILRRGIIEVKEELFELSSFEEIEVDQNVVGKIFDYGSILINRGIAGKLILIDVPNPFHWAHIFRERSKKEQNQT